MLDLFSFSRLAESTVLAWLKRRLPGKEKIPADLRARIINLQHRIGYRFRHPDLLLTALKHRSFLDSSSEDRSLSNERLEFLGDAVLDLVVSDYFYHDKSRDGEGILTNIKSTIVCGQVLVAQARQIDLGQYILLGENEARHGIQDRDSILEDAFEALIGAIYLDGGLKAARRFILQFLLNEADKILAEKDLKNYKSALQELAQSRGWGPPTYSVLKESGPDHDKRYLVEVRLGDRVVGTGSGRTKKQAEQRAAAEGMKKMETSRDSLPRTVEGDLRP